MANVVLHPTQARNSIGIRWNLLNNCLADDAAYTYRSSGGLTTEYLVLDNFSAGLPQDITINGISVTLKASTDVSGSNAHISGFFSLNGVLTNPLYISSTQTASSLTTSEVTYTLGGSTFLWGLNWRRPQIHGQPRFSLYLSATGNLNVGRKVQYVYITVYYTLNTYLKGERSAFPPDFSTLPYQGFTDIVPVKYNGTGSSNQINAEDCNLLGDCLYNIEQTILNPSHLIRSEGGSPTDFSPQSLFAFSATVSGSWAGGAELIYFHNTQRIYGQTLLPISNDTTTNLTNVRWIKPPVLPLNPNVGILMPMVMGCAWLLPNATGSPIGLPITNTTCMFRRIQEFIPLFTDVMSSSVGFQLFSNITSSALDEQTTDFAGRKHTGYDFRDFYTIPTGTVIVKLQGFALVGV